MLSEHKKEAALRLKVAHGHLEGIRKMVEEDAYCIDLMKQLAAVQGTLSRVQQIFLHNHLSSCVQTAIKEGMGESIISELMQAFKYNRSLIDGSGAFVSQALSASEMPSAALGAPCCGDENRRDSFS